jgi:hypothetical protein
MDYKADADLDKILTLGIELNSMNKAIKQLLNNGKIKENTISSYYYRIQGYQKYKDYSTEKKDRLKNKFRLAKMMYKKGMTYEQIGKRFNINFTGAFYLVNPEKRNERLKKSEREKRIAQDIVNYWNKHNIENRFPTDETIKAFEKLNLTPPERL